jgi:hypothetical protein
MADKPLTRVWGLLEHLLLGLMSFSGKACAV